MKKILYALLMVFLFTTSSSLWAQTTAQWQWAKVDTPQIQINPTYLKQVVAAHNDKVLWGTLQNNGIPYGQESYGNYKLTEYDTAGNAGTTIVLKGKVYLADAKADAAGNWYILASYYDSLQFPGMPVMAKDINDPLSPSKFLFRLNSGSLSLAWFKPLGGDNMCNVQCFTIHNNTIYLPIDSGATNTKICRYDLGTGNRTTLFTQGGENGTSALELDDNGAIYIAGSCNFQNFVNFNGTISNVPAYMTYPVYIARYKPNGQFDWVHWMKDITCIDRKILIANSNTIYYTGVINDTLTLGTTHFHRPRWLYDFLVARLDSTGNIAWTRQLKDTLEGDANLTNLDVLPGPDTSLLLAPEVRGYIDWGNSINTYVGNGINNLSDAAVINISAGGQTNWVKPGSSLYTSSQHMAVTGNSVWITGIVRDSTAVKFDNVSAPVPPLTTVPYMAKLKIAGPTGISHLLPVITFSIVPNPATNIISIYGLEQISGNGFITITDVSGRVVYSTITDHASDKSINVSNFARGLYFIEIGSSTYTKVQKLLLQ